MENYIVSFYLFSFLCYLFDGLFIKSRGIIKPKFLSRIALGSLWLGFFGNLYLIMKHILEIRRLPLTNTQETALTLITLMVFIFLILRYKNQLSAAAGLFVSLFSFIGLFLLFYFKRSPVPLLPALQSKWLIFHVTSCIVAYGFFAVAFISAIISLFKRPIKTTVLATTHRCVWAGFFFLTLGIILGSVWGKSAWGHWWNWDPKETWALITWLIYGYYIQNSSSGGGSRKMLLLVAIVGFLSCLFTYLGINFLLKGLHSYA